MKKTLLLLALAFVSLRGMAYSIAADGIYYNIISAGVLEVTHGEQPYSGYVSIPDSVRANGKMYSVEAIGDRAFNACRQLSSLRMPSGLKRIGQSAFASCTALHYVSLPAKLQTIDDAAFYGCTSLVSIALPATVSSIGKDAFVQCTMLERITVDEGNTVYTSVDNVLYNKGVTRLIAYPNAKGDAFLVPQTVTAIADGAFSHCVSLVSVSLPASLKSIGDAAFYGCKALQTITLPSAIVSVGRFAFAECESLSSVNVPASLITIGDDAFTFCTSLQSINAESQNPQYASADGVLFDKQLTTIVAYPGGKGPNYSVPQTVTKIDTHAFYGSAALKSITIHQGVASIEDNPFVFCENLTDINVASDNSMYSSYDGILYNKEQTGIVTVPKGRDGLLNVPSSVSDIATGAFLCNGKLQAVSLPRSVKTIGEWAFLGCYELSTVNLPASLSTVGRGAFSDCVGLQEIVCCGQPVDIGPVSSVVSNQTRLYVPRGEMVDFLQAEGWKDFRRIEEYGIRSDYMQLNRGRLQNVPVRIDGTLPLTALQMDIEVPDGMHVAQNETGGYMVNMTGANANTHKVSCTKINDHAYTLVVVSMENAVLEQTDTLFCIGMDIDQDCLAGNYEIGVSNIVLTYMTRQLYGEAMQRDCLAQWNVRNYMGDVNHDGLVNVADVVLTLRHVQNLPTDDFHFTEADINSSGAVTVSDAVGIIDIIQKELLFATPGITDGGQTTSTDQMTGADVHIMQGMRSDLEIELTNAVGDYTAQQFELTLPEGIAINKDIDGKYVFQATTRYDTHKFYITPVEGSFYPGNTYRIVCASNSLKEIREQSGVIMKLQLVADSDLPDVKLAGLIHHVVFADKMAKPYELPNSEFEVLVGNKTGIDEVAQQQQPSNIYSLQGLLVRTQTTSLKGLQPGIYIMNGKKYVVK